MFTITKVFHEKIKHSSVTILILQCQNILFKENILFPTDISLNKGSANEKNPIFSFANEPIYTYIHYFIFPAESLSINKYSNSIG